MSSPPFLLQGRVSRGVALSSCIVNINLVIKQYLAWFVYRLGRELNTLARRVRFPHRVHLLPFCPGIPFFFGRASRRGCVRRSAVGERCGREGEGARCARACSGGGGHRGNGGPLSDELAS